MKKKALFPMLALVLVLALALALPAALVSAGTPDGPSGPWADSVESFDQGQRKDGSAVLPERSDPTAALGPAENVITPPSFVSLGFGGEIILGFDNCILNGDGDDIEVAEVTGGSGYSNERVEVQVSQDGTNWEHAGYIPLSDTTTNPFSGTVPLPAGMDWAKYVKLVDVTNPGPHSSNADGYDLDGVRANYSSEGPCNPGPLEVAIDIKPTSCPNPLNVKSKGVLPVAILGAEDFDVTEVDVSTVRLEGVVAPLRWALEDVATPYDGELVDCEGCSTEGPDGYVDLTLKFDTQAVVEAIGEVEDGDCLELVLTGELLDTTLITGSDWVLIIKKGKK